MAIADHKSSSSSDGKVWGFFKRPFRPSGNATTTTTSSSSMSQSNGDGSILHASSSMAFCFNFLKKDYKDGSYSQQVANHLDTKLRDDLERLKKIMSE